MAETNATGRRGRILIGTQGWSYDRWQGLLYPPKTPSKDRLRYYARLFDVVEVDSTYYRIPTPDSVRHWADQAPDGFLLVPKVPGEITTGRQPGPRRPARTGAPRTSAGGGSAYAMGSDKQQEETWAFFKHIMSKPMQEIFMNATGAMVGLTGYTSWIVSACHVQPATR